MPRGAGFEPAQTAPEDLVAFRYPLAAAIADELVKTPVMVARRDDRTDTETKLLDGVNLLRYKGAAADAYCIEHELPRVNPVMLVIAGSIEEAREYQDVLDSSSFDAGAWVGTTLLVHSKLTGDEKERALADLQAVEEPDSPVRIIISIGMLKEGWDVKNVYVIASMRASVSTVLTEQTLGRGMRLPFGRYTRVEFLDTLEVLAHEKYGDLLKKRSVLNEAFIDYGTYAHLRRAADGSLEVRQTVIPAPGPVIPAPRPSAMVQTGDPATSEEFLLSPEPGDLKTAPASTAAAPTVGIVDQESRARQARKDAQSGTIIEYSPLPDREPIVIPRLVSVAQPTTVSLNDIDPEDYGPFQRLGRALVTEHSEELRRTKLSASHNWQKAQVRAETARDSIRAALPLDIPLTETRKALIRRVMSAKDVPQRKNEYGAAERIVDCVIEAMGDEAQGCLSAFVEVCGQRLVRQISKTLRDFNPTQIMYTDDVEWLAIDKTRKAQRKQEAGHADGAFDKALAFNGWQKNLYSHAWFDSSPEFQAAGLIDSSSSVVVWARLHINDVPIQWTTDGRNYNPDFVVIEEVDGKRFGWLVETKSDKDMSTAEVQAKRRAAKKWANTANSSPQVRGVTWKYLLAGEQDVEDAAGLWGRLKEFCA
ncbi:restriction endonuclease [Streptomyces sp. NPDC004592]